MNSGNLSVGEAPWYASYKTKRLVVAFKKGFLLLEGKGHYKTRLRIVQSQDK